MPYITHIASQAGGYAYENAKMMGFFERMYGKGEALRKFNILLNDRSIQTRHSVLPDFQGSEALLYKNGMPSTADRMAIYAKEALQLAKSASVAVMEKGNKSSKQITHIIAVSCTGLMAPGLETLLAEALGLSNKIQRHAVNFMGCYAAFHGLRLANMIAQTDANSCVLLVCVELCSLHFRQDISDDNILSSSIFADGAAACLIEPKASSRAINLHAFQSELLPNSQQAMGWYVGNHGFEMILSKQVPQHILEQMGQSVEAFLALHGLRQEELAHFAIHPGGKRILQAFECALGVSSQALSESYEVLKSYGNMSSATVLFVLQRLLEGTHASGWVYSAAFGPGLTIESGLFHLEQ